MKNISEEVMKSFEKYLYEDEKSGNTIEKYMRDIRFFKEWTENRELNKALVLDYKKELCGKYAPKSVNSILSSLNALFTYMNWYDLKVKTLKIQRQIFANQNKELTEKEYEKLLKIAQKANNKLYLIMQTICSTGIRVSELKYITVEAVLSEQATINLKGKMRKVFLPSELCRKLRKYISKEDIKNGSVFVTKSGKPVDRSNIWASMKKLCSSAGVNKDKVFPHNLRHLFARTYYKVQKDIVRLADILGHTSIDTTRIYTMENGEIHKRQIQNLGLLRC